MEPVEWVIGIILIFGGYEIFSKEPKVETPVVIEQKPVVSEVPIFERGRFYKTNHGYFISDLSPNPVEADGCERPVLVADLTKNDLPDEHLVVSEVDIKCGG